jgi:hypothetical protein
MPASPASTNHHRAGRTGLRGHPYGPERRAQHLFGYNENSFRMSELNCRKPSFCSRVRDYPVAFGSPETDSQFPKARHWPAFLRLLRVKSPGAGLVGWGGRIRTSIWRIRNRMLSPVREESQDPISLNKPLETFEFREPYRISRVQSTGEKWAIRRRMCRLCRLKVRSLNKKSLLLAGSIANKFA